MFGTVTLFRGLFVSQRHVRETSNTRLRKTTDKLRAFYHKVLKVRFTRANQEKDVGSRKLSFLAYYAYQNHNYGIKKKLLNKLEISL